MGQRLPRSKHQHCAEGAPRRAASATTLAQVPERPAATRWSISPALTPHQVPAALRPWHDADSIEAVLSLGSTQQSEEEAEKWVRRAWTETLTQQEAAHLLCDRRRLIPTPLTLATMRPTQEFTGDMVDAFMYLIRAQLPDITVLSLTFLRTLRDEHEAGDSGRTASWTSHKSSPWLPPLDPKERNRGNKQVLDRHRGVFIPVHTPGHWSVIYLEVASRTCYFFCSMDYVLRKLDKKLLERRLALDFDERPLVLTWVKVPVPKQRWTYDRIDDEGLDCGARAGIHAVMAVMALHIPDVLWGAMAHTELGVRARMYVT